MNPMHVRWKDYSSRRKSPTVGKQCANRERISCPAAFKGYETDRISRSTRYRIIHGMGLQLRSQFGVLERFQRRPRICRKGDQSPCFRRRCRSRGLRGVRSVRQTERENCCHRLHQHAIHRVRLPFRMGVEYFVSANSVESSLWANSCGQTRPALVAAALIRQARAIHAGQRPAALFGFIGTEPYPGISPLSRLEAKPAASVAVTAVGRAGEFRAITAADASFEFSRLPESTYHLRVQLPQDLFIWWASTHLSSAYAVSPGKMCEADFPLYPKDDPFAANQPR